MKQEKRSELLHDALNLLEDDMIEEVEKLRGGVVKSIEEDKIVPISRKSRYGWRKWTAIAASVCVLVTAGYLYDAFISQNTQGTYMDEGSESGAAEGENIITGVHNTATEVVDNDASSKVESMDDLSEELIFGSGPENEVSPWHLFVEKIRMKIQDCLNELKESF